MHIKAYYAVTEYNPEYSTEHQVIVSDSNISFHWYEQQVPRYDIDSISYNDIVSVEFLPISKTPAGAKRGFTQGKPLVAFVGGARDVGYGNNFVQFYIDMNIITKEGTLGFESVNMDNIPAIIDILKSHSIEVADPTNFYDLFNKTSDRWTIVKHFESHYKKWAKELQLENPRKFNSADNNKIYTYWQKKKQ